MCCVKKLVMVTECEGHVHMNKRESEWQCVQVSDTVCMYIISGCGIHT